MILKKVCCIILVISTAVITAAVPVHATSSTEDGMTGVSAQGEPAFTERSLADWTAQQQYENSWRLDWKDALINNCTVNLNSDGMVLLKSGQTLSFSANLTKSDSYKIFMTYCLENALYISCDISMTVNKIEYETELPVLWSDATTDYVTDRNGNDQLPEQISVPKPYTAAIRLQSDINKSDVVLELSAGTHRFSFTAGSQNINLVALYIAPIQQTVNYADYTEQNSDKSAETQTQTVTIEAEHYNVKSDSFIRAKSRKNAALSPYNTYYKVLNVLDEGSWNSAGQKMIWEFEIEKEGFYEIAFRYLQNSDVNKPVFRRIELDGQLPFSEWEAVPFSNTETNKYENYILTVGNQNAKVWLTAGKHTISMQVTVEPYREVYEKILNLMDDLNSLAMDLKKLTAGQEDQNRTWDMDYYMPEAISQIDEYAGRIDEIYSDLAQISGVEPSYADNLKYASAYLRKLLKKPNEIPNKCESISQGDSSASKYLGNVLSSLTNMPLSIDRIYISDGSELESASVSVFVKIWESFKNLLWSFTTSQKTSDFSTAGTGKSKELTVWVNRSAPYVQVLQQLVDSDYNSTRNTNIRLSIMPNEQKLILANATGSNPDVVLGANINTPFNFAIRSAAKNLLEYEDFITFYNDNYSLESLVPVSYGEGVYGAVESQNFYVLFYRKDILNALGIEVPKTWSDVRYIMPKLLRYSMNFYMPLSADTAYKNMDMTGPLILQHDGSYVSESGQSSGFKSENTMDALDEMTELYTIYGMKSAVPSFYNSFRYGEIPLGVADFNTYIQLQVAAPELAGKWDITLTPGTLLEDGTIVRCTPAAATAAMIFENTDKPEQSWDFLKWWLSTDTQVRYAFLMQSTYGSEYRWNTANINAFSQMSYSTEHKQIILQQWEDQNYAIRHPANYMLERACSNIWNGVVVDGKSLITEIERATMVSDREITRKLKEFKFLDDSGNVIKDYNVNIYEMLQNALKDAEKETKS